VFKTFADGFGEAYKPLLTEIQQAFDASIQQGLQDAVENGILRQQLLEAGHQQAVAEDAVTAEVISGQWGIVHVGVILVSVPAVKKWQVQLHNVTLHEQQQQRHHAHASMCWQLC
jgi:hydrogenase maturation factor